MAEHEDAPMAPAPDSTTADPDQRIADAEELERFASTPGAELTPAIRGVIAEIALTSLIRYPWPLLAPVLHRLIDAALDSLAAADTGRQELAPDEAGPPAPLPDGSSLEESRAGLHALLDAFSAPPFTLQRLCEVLLEPKKQYSRVHKLAMALERTLLVTSTQEMTPAPLPPRPTLRSLGPVNENPPSPYDGEPPAGPPPAASEDHLRGGLGGALRIAIGNGGDGGGGGSGGLGGGEGEYAIFVGAEPPTSPGAAPLPPELVTGEAAAVGVAVGVVGIAATAPPPMAPAEVMQAEAFVQAALATPPEAAEEDLPEAAAAAVEEEEEAQPSEAEAVAMEGRVRDSDSGEEPPAKRQELESAGGDSGVRLSAVAADEEGPAGTAAVQDEAQDADAGDGNGPVAMETEEAPVGAGAGEGGTAAAADGATAQT